MKKVFLKHGFSLIEILVAIAAGSIIIVTLYSTYAFTSKMHLKNVNQEELSQNARIAMERISRDIRQAQLIVTDLPPTDTDVLNPPPSEIQFEDGHFTNKTRYIKYYLENNNLKRRIIHYYFSSNPNIWVAWNAQDEFGNLPQESSDEDTTKADKISTLSFFGSNPINIKIGVSNNDNSFYYSTKIFGRNI